MPRNIQRTKQAQTQVQGQRLAQRIQRQLADILERDTDSMIEKVKNELEENPALEQIREEGDDLREELEGGEVTAEGPEMELPYTQGDDDPADEPMNPLFEGYASPTDEVWTPPVVERGTLADYLMDQLMDLDLTEKQELIAEHIVGNLSSDGLLRYGVSDIAYDLTYNEHCETEDDEVTEVLRLVQRMDPPGVAATSVQECLLLQLRRKPRTVDTVTAMTILEKEFRNFTDHNYSRIALRLEIDEATVRRVIEKEINTLTPRPGSAFADAEGAPHVTPDFDVAYNDDGGITVTLHNRIPELEVAQSYREVVSEYEKRPPESRYERQQAQIIRANYHAANAFIELLRMRQENLFAVMNAIVESQRDYFMSGHTADLRPLRMEDVAQRVGCDVSTISRAVRNKYVAMPGGRIMELRQFFQGGIGTRDGEEGITTREVMEALQALVDSEDKTAPLSDEALAAKLATQGYNISRRTVSKYRSRLHIPTATQRKA